MKRTAVFLTLALLIAGGVFIAGQSRERMIGVNVVLKGGITKAALAELGRFGRIRDEIPALNAVTMQARASGLAAIQALPMVA
jgi:glucokinase